MNCLLFSGEGGLIGTDEVGSTALTELPPPGRRNWNWKRCIPPFSCSQAFGFFYIGFSSSVDNQPMVYLSHACRSATCLA